MEEKISYIKSWLGSNSIDIFGLPMSGKDTVGKNLADLLGAKFLSSGDIIREMEAKQNNHMSDNGQLIPTNVFYEWVLPYFGHDELKNHGLILSSIGRWSGEENEVMDAAKNGGHEIIGVIWLNVSEDEVLRRWELANQTAERGRSDDNDIETFKVRLREFREKTLPVIEHYDQLGRLISVPVEAEASKEVVFESVIDRLYNFALKSPNYLV